MTRGDPRGAHVQPQMARATRHAAGRQTKQEQDGEQKAGARGRHHVSRYGSTFRHRGA